MSNVLPLAQPLPRLDEDAWEALLDFIEERRVIPIVGPELLKVETDSGPRLLYDWLAEKLAAKLDVDTSRLPQPYTLNDVVCWHLAARGRREDTYTRMRGILRDASFAPPKALRQLAQIGDFDLFVSTTFDPFLENAINAERFGGAQTTEVVSYAPNRVAATRKGKRLQLAQARVIRPGLQSPLRRVEGEDGLAAMQEVFGAADRLVRGRDLFGGLHGSR